MLEHLMCGTNPTIREKLGVRGSLLIVWYHARGEACDESEYQCFKVGIFLFIECIDITQQVSRIFVGGIAPCVAVYTVHPWEEGSSRSYYVTNFVNFL